MSKDTRIHLVAELVPLHARATGEQRQKLATILAEARAGEYHDYKNTKYACGKMAANSALQVVGMPECDALAAHIRNGEYDEEPDAEDRAELDQIVSGLRSTGFDVDNLKRAVMGLPRR
jgi:hypothetical protein